MSSGDMGYAKAKAVFEELRLKHARLLGVRDSLLRRKEELTLKVAQAKGRLELEEEIKGVFEALQEKAHRRSIGPYETLLSACVRDVFPEKGGADGLANGIVKLELGQHLGLPALDLHINNDGFREDILTANGGSINNVVVAGLRVSALAQTPNRRLLVLDEPDIWVKPERVPNFVKMLSEVATKSQTQMLMISHHVSEYFEGHASIIKLYTEGSETRATVLEPRVAAWPDNVVPGVRYMRLINVRAHRDTLIPFMPGLNSFIGDNDLGKSTALVSGFRAVAYNDADDTLFSHDRSENRDQILEAKIIIGLENDTRIEYTRYLKKSPKVMYRVYVGDSEEPVFEGRPPVRGQVPEKIEELLGIKRVDGLDIQLRSQKSPIFLLDEAPSVRAKLLSVGRESGHFVALNEAYRKLNKADSKTVADGEAELTRIDKKLPILDRLVELQGLVSIHTTLVKKVDAAQQLERTLAKTITTIEESKRVMDSCNRKLDVLSNLPAAPPVLADNSRLLELVNRLAELEPKAALSLKPLSLKVPHVEDYSRLNALTDRLEGLAKKAELTLPPLTVQVPVLEDLSRLAATCARLEVLSRRAAINLPELKIVVPVVSDNSRLIEVGARLSSLQRKSELLAQLPPVDLKVPVVESNEGLVRKAQLLQKLGDQVSAATAELEATEREEKALSAQNKALREQIGNFCPLCEGELPEGGLVHAH